MNRDEEKLLETNERLRLLYEELEKKNQELSKLDQLKSDFISTVSHELRTPLTIVKVALSSLRDGVVGELSEKQNQVLETAFRNVNRLAHLISDLLDLSRLESGKIRLNKRSIDLNILFHEINHNFQKSHEINNIQLDYQAQDVPHAYGDPDMIIQVLTNLIHNALRFAKSHVTLKASLQTAQPEATASHTGPFIRVDITNDGSGINPEDQKKLFTKFVQLNRPMGGAGYKGTGLGLSICRDIIEHHHGCKIWLASSQENVTTFSFTLPVWDENVYFYDVLKAPLIEAEGEISSLALILVGSPSFNATSGDAHTNEIHDQLIKSFRAKIVNEVLRKKDNVLPYLYQNHLVLIAKMAKEGAIATIERLKPLADQVEISPNQHLEITTGYAVYPEDTADAMQLFHLAMENIQKRTS